MKTEVVFKHKKDLSIRSNNQELKKVSFSGLRLYKRFHAFIMLKIVALNHAGESKNHNKI